MSKAKVNLVATANTVLKVYAVDSDLLVDSAKVSLKKGTILTGIHLGTQEGHYYLELEEPLNGSKNWYAYVGHWDLREVNPEAAPVVSEALKPHGRGASIKVAGVKSVVYLGDAICSVSPNFFWYEATHDGMRIPQNPTHTSNIIKMAAAAQKVRVAIGKPLKITSWYRPEPWNSRCGGATNSTHLSGMALDFLVDGMTGRQLASMLHDWEGGMGIYRRFPNLLHIDVRGYRARWGGA